VSDINRARRLVLLSGISGVVLVAAGLAFVLGGGLGGATAPTAVPSGTGSLPPVTGSPTPSGTPAQSSPSAGSEPGIVATRIKIDRLGIDLAIIEGDGIDAPIGKAAHYPGTAWPDGGSNIYIYGHARVGMFRTLWQARTGDTIELVLVDGTSRTYVVTQVLPEVSWDALQHLEPTPAEQLTLQTSTGVDPTDPRFIVIAVPAP
jgi:LPXTG-site transpeptidase (sortase) family protein